jgi:hypothetical protein
MENKKPIAVIILNWNGEKLLNEFLPAVVANTDASIADVIVADNGSTDGSVALIESRFPSVGLVKFDKNYGFAEGYNRAIAATRYTYTLLLNSDVAPAKGWLNPLFDYLESHPATGACQPKLLSYTEPGRFEYAGASGGFIDRNGYPYCRGRMFSTVEDDHGQYDDIIPVFWATGAALMIRTAIYIEAGGLDKDFFAHMEEIDLCWRVSLMGHDIVVVPASVAYHLGGGSLPASNPRKTYLNFRNNLLLLHKNLPSASRRATLTRRRLLDTIAFLKFALTLDWRDAMAIVKAHRDFRSMRRRYTAEPPAHDLLRERPDCRLNLLTAYYLRRHTRFSDIH